MHITQLRKRVWQDPTYFMAFGFGSGLSSFAPGTMGTLMAFPLYALIAHTRWYIYLSLILIGFLWGVKICNRVTDDLGIEDYRGIVWDEIVGYLLTLFLVPPSITWMLVGFCLFRLFDIWKPQPISLFEKQFKGGLGVMLDDIVAAAFAWMILQMLIWLT